MQKGLAIVLSLLIVVGGSGCSSRPTSLKPKPGVLPPGTARLTINGVDAVTTNAVQCSTTEHLMTFTIGNDPAVATAMVSNASQLSALLVRIHDPKGFTGAYGHDLGGNAQVTMAESTYQIVGTAEGFDSGAPSVRSREKFELWVSC